MRPDKGWNRCDICGRFISYADFDAEQAHRFMVTPDSEVSSETWGAEHLACAEALQAERIALMGEETQDERCLL